MLSHILKKRKYGVGYKYMNQSFLILGREKGVCLAEIYQFLGRNGKIISNFGMDAIVVSDSDFGVSCAEILGGVPKSGIVIGRIHNLDANSLLPVLSGFAKEGQKFHFGLSSYSVGARAMSQKELKTLGLETKKLLKQQGASVRLVESKSENLSSVDVVKNKLLDKGVELCLLFLDAGVLIGKTQAVQPFEDYSHRDYDRPARDMKRGMIPPKLARSMVNMSGAQVEDLILDPFCGIGTILQEALLMGYRMIGTDIDEQAIRDTRKNIEWLGSQYKQELPEPKIDAMDVRTLDKTLTKNSVDAIVTEFDLGPSMQGDESRAKVESIERSLSEFYMDALDMMRFVLKDNKRAVVAWPYFVKHDIFISAFDKIVDFGWRAIEPYPEKYQKVYPLSNRGTLLYGREGQHVFREILILEKI